jgi:hypothetical protein
VAKRTLTTIEAMNRRHRTVRLVIAGLLLAEMAVGVAYGLWRLN